jgi:hypothetical protein
MPIRWETFPVELTGGLVSNLSRLQQGMKMPGSARLLQNFEPSIKGGYRRINGYTKFDSAPVPPYGDVRVQASGQTGTSLDVANMHETPAVGNTFTVAGVAGTYTISALAYSSTNKSATLTITPSLDSSPADVAVVTFVTGSSRIEGTYFCPTGVKAFSLRGGALWSSVGTGWSFVNTPDYGTVLVNGGSQTGTSLIVDDIASDTYTPQVGDTFTVAGVEQVYTVTVEATVASGASTLTISPALATSPADNAAITFLAISLSGGTKARFHLFNFNGTPKNVMVDNFNNPTVFTGTTCVSLQGSSDVTGASFVEEFKDHLFFAKGDLISHTAPFDEADFTPGNGAGSYRLPGDCTGLITFREQMVNFSQSDIRKLQGSSLADFTLTSIANDTGCIEGDSVKEVGGDVLYLAPDGIRFLGATERIGDFNLSIASRQIQGEMSNFITSGSSYSAVTVRGKNQYRIFKYVQGGLSGLAEGFIGSQFLDQNALSINWGKAKGLNVYRAHSAYTNDEEYVVFSNDDEYVYRMESGSTFDGEAITSRYYTPFMVVSDPTLRKTAYKVDTYFDPEGAVSGTLTLKYDFNKPGKIQPETITFTGGGVFSLYGEDVYGTSTYGGNPDTSFESRVVGSFFTASLQYEFDGGPPFILDTVILEYATEDRK